MLTSSDYNLSPLQETSSNKLNITLKSEQIVTAERCLRFAYQGLQWAFQYTFKGSLNQERLLNRRLQHHLNSLFWIEDDYIIGIFKDCYGPQLEVSADWFYPKTLQEYLDLQATGKSFIVSEIVLEKETLRLASRRASTQASKFIKTLVHPALMGVIAHYSNYFSQLNASEERPAGIFNEAKRSTGMSDDYAGNLKLSLNTEFLTHILLANENSNQFWLEHSPLSLFYDIASPFNIKCPETRRWRETFNASADGWSASELVCDAV